MVELKIGGVQIQFTKRQSKSIQKMECADDPRLLKVTFAGEDVRHFDTLTGKIMFPEFDGNGEGEPSE